MATWRVNNSTTIGGKVCAEWVPNTAYSLGARVVCRIAYGTTARRAYVYECTTAGTSHGSTEPTWPTSGTVNDNDVVWTTRSPNDGSWDNASCYLHYILNHTTIAAGDSVYVDDGHSEAPNFSSTRIILKGTTTVNNPIKVLCVDKTDDSLSVGALVHHNNATYGLYVQDYGYSYGVTYQGKNLGASTDGGWIFESDGDHDVFVLETELNTCSSWNKSPFFIIRNGGINFTSTSGHILPGNGHFQWHGGTLTAASGVTKLIDGRSVYGNGTTEISDVDLSAVGETKALVDAGDGIRTFISFTRCKLPAGAFTPVTGTWPGPLTNKVRLHHCSSANATYDFSETSYEGIIEDNISIYRSGGASDGTTALSAKMVSSAGCVDNLIALESIPIHGWTSSTTEKTFTVEGVWDSATNIQNDEIWVELEYPADNSSGLGAIAKDKCAILGTPADQTASTETWTGTDGFSNENKFKLSVTVTPGKAGPITAKVYLAKPSTTVYIDPKITEN